MENIRINQGYAIIDSIHLGEVEFVLGVNKAKPSCFVTWQCRDGSNYLWGHYFFDCMEAKKDLLERAGEEMKYLLKRKERAAEIQTKKPDKECER